MKNYLYLPALMLLLFTTSCSQEDHFTGLWNKDANPLPDGAAFPSWTTKGIHLVDTHSVKSPLFVRIKKELGYYVMNSYQFDIPKNAIVRDPSIFDFVKFTKEDEYTLISDNNASNILTSKRITIQVDPASRSMTMHFDMAEEEMPTDKRTKALFRTMFGSSYHKLMEIRRKTEDAGLIDKKLKSDHIILGQ